MAESSDFVIPEYQYKVIPADCSATHAIIRYKWEVFAEVPMTFALPCKEYLVIMAAIDQVFNTFNPDMRDALLWEWTSGLLMAMRWQLDEQTCDQFVYQSNMMQEYTIDLAFKI